MNEQGFNGEPNVNAGQISGAVQADMLFGAGVDNAALDMQQIAQSQSQLGAQPVIQPLGNLMPAGNVAPLGNVAPESNVAPVGSGMTAGSAMPGGTAAPVEHGAFGASFGQAFPQPMPQQVEATAFQPMEMLFEQPLGQQPAPVAQPADQPVGQASVQEIAQEPIQPANQSNAQYFGQPQAQPFEQPMAQPAPQAQPFEQQTSQPEPQAQPFEQPMAQPAPQAFDQGLLQSLNQPVTQVAPLVEAEAPLAPDSQAGEGTGHRFGISSFYKTHEAMDVFSAEDDDDEEDEDVEADDSSKYAYMQNRELSWLTFNERVLDQGADESVPLLERLNFISIFWSNLQEFFMVRVGSLTDLTFIEPPVKDSKTGMTPKEQIQAIHERCRELYPIQESYYEHVRGSLAKQGVRHLRPDDLSEEQVNYLSGFVTYNVMPFLSPQIINPTHPFPHLENGKLYILVRLDDQTDAAEGKKKGKKDKKAKKEKGGAEGVVLGLIPLPHQCERIIKLPGRGFQFILLEHAIEMFAAETFSMYKIKHTNVICVTRNADIDANQTGDEQDEDYREHMRRLLKKRARLAPVRLECERPLSPVMEKHMLKKLRLKRSQVYDTIVPLDLSFTWELGSKLSDKKREKLSNPPFSPAWPTAFDRKRRILDQVGEREVLLSYPYESMDPFVQLLKEAAFDPTVVSIKITLYRLASQSQLAEALITAAENGKNVTALFELRARFDESNNIEWSQRFEEAGCNVIYGFRDYKVHSKICCITRQTPQGLQHITQLGTGNYNEKTAKLYTDLSFITTDESFGRDAVEFFRNMQLENVSDNYEVLRVAPLQIKPMILDNLDHQIELARQGKPCGAFLKANSITDKDVIEKIAEASQAGVGITLFIRGICCIVPEVKGWTDNVRVVSIVGRLLEHSRIYCFGTPDDCVMYLSSADLMTRNLNKRVEIAWPILNQDLRWRILDYIDLCLRDTAKLRELRPNKTYTPLGAFCEIDEEGNAQPAFDAQAALIARAAEKARLAEDAQDSYLQGEAEVQPAIAQPMQEAAAPVQIDPVVQYEQPFSASANDAMTPSVAFGEQFEGVPQYVDATPQQFGAAGGFQTANVESGYQNMPVTQPLTEVPQQEAAPTAMQADVPGMTEMRIEDILGDASPAVPAPGQAQWGFAGQNDRMAPQGVVGAPGPMQDISTIEPIAQPVDSNAVATGGSLTDMSIGDLLEPQPPVNAGQAGQAPVFQPAADPVAMTGQMPAQVPGQVSQAYQQPLPQGMQQGMQQGTQQGMQQGMPQQPSGANPNGQPDFFEEGNRPLEMPPKKKGLFKRFRK